MEKVADDFIETRDEYTLYFYMHFMHAAEIIGYKHPDNRIAAWWRDLYFRMVNALHLYPESELSMEGRLGK